MKWHLLPSVPQTNSEHCAADKTTCSREREREFDPSPPSGSGIFVTILTPRGESPRLREINIDLVCLAFSNNCSHSFFTPSCPPNADLVSPVW